MAKKNKQMIEGGDATEMVADQEQAADTASVAAPAATKKQGKYLAHVNMHLPSGKALVAGERHDLEKDDLAHIHKAFGDNKHHIITE